MLNALTVDVEDYYHVEAFASSVAPEDWDSFPSRIERNVSLILEIFERHAVRGTFFVLGWVAERFPKLVRDIATAGHEIGCHGSAHQRILKQTPDQFRADIRTARRRLMDQVQKPVELYRAPSFSIVDRTIWALNVLAEEGFRIDSSIFPVRHDLYGMPGEDRFPHWKGPIFEFPPSTVRIGHTNWGVGGGGYLRLFPYNLTRWALRCINERERQPAMVYFHPWELDPDQPRISAPIRSRLRHYTNLSGMRRKIERLLRDFQFDTISEVAQQLEVFKNRQ